MRRIIALTLIAILCVGLFACGQPAETPKEVVRMQQTIEAKDLQGKVKLLGRTSFTEKGIACDWSGTGISFIVNCEGDVSMNVDAKTSSSNYNINWRVFVDGVENERRLSIQSADTFSLAKGLTAGEHEIMLVRDTAVQNYNMFIQGLNMNCDADTMKPSADKELLIDFTGTSISCGSGTLSMYDVKRENESATRSYAFRTCAALDADWVYSCRGTMGITNAVEAGGVSFVLPTLYESAYGYRDPEPKYEWTRHPDIVIMEVGPNDKVPADEFVTAAVDYANQIRGHHPDCKLVFYHGFGKDKYCDVYDTIVEKLGGTAAGVWNCKTVGGNGASDGIHPTVEQHQANADILVKFLQDNVIPTIKK